MRFKTVLAVVGAEQTSGDIETAIKIASDIGAHLSVLAVCIAAPPPIGEYASVVSTPWLEERQADQERLAESLDHVRNLLATSTLAHDADSLYCDNAWADRDVGERARFADITLIGADSLVHPDLKSHAVNGALFESARPVLILPKDCAPTITPDIVMLAWDNRIEAARAVYFARDMLADAHEVHITMIDPAGASGKYGEPGADIATYLARSGVRAIVDPMPSGGRPIATVIRERATDLSADMIVMGAYSHSRMRERIFGGVTISMVHGSTIPLFLAH